MTTALSGITELSLRNLRVGGSNGTTTLQADCYTADGEKLAEANAKNTTCRVWITLPITIETLSGGSGGKFTITARGRGHPTLCLLDGESL